MAQDLEKIRKEQNISNLNEIILNPIIDYEEGKLYEHELNIKERKVRIVIVKHNGKFYCLNGIDTYDGKTRLYKGVVFGDKLLSPDNGSAFNIINGTVENGPALDNLPIFQVKEDSSTGMLKVYIPDIPPKRLKPLLVGRDYNDQRRIIILGSDPAVISCVETLRQFEYTVSIRITLGRNHCHF